MVRRVKSVGTVKRKARRPVKSTRVKRTKNTNFRRKTI